MAVLEDWSLPDGPGLTTVGVGGGTLGRSAVKMLTGGDLCDATGLPMPRLQAWCRLGYLVPVEGGEGRGSDRRFTLMQTLGVAVALKLLESERGCALSRAGKVIAAFAATDEAELLKRFDEGATYFILVYGDDLMLTGPQYRPDQVDVKQAYEELQDRIGQIACREQAQVEARGGNGVKGRTRGFLGDNKLTPVHGRRKRMP